MESLADIINRLLGFMELGGQVLWLIGLLLLSIWVFVFERIWYYRRSLLAESRAVIMIWQARVDKTSWRSRQIRARLLSQMSMRIEQNLALIRALIALSPLLGLLGTVTGMIEVFNVMSVTGGGDAKAMAGGVSRATIPTMAGMVVALSGIFANTYISKIAEREKTLLKDHLTYTTE